MGLFDGFFQSQADPNSGGAILTPEQIQLRQLMAQRLMQQGGDTSPIQSPWQGAARLAQGIVGGLQQRRLNQDQAAQNAAIGSHFANFTGDAAGQSPVNAAAPAVPPVADSGAAAAPDAAQAVLKNGGTGNDIPTFARLLQIEGNGKNPNSSARGIGQVIDSTWKQYALPGQDRNNPNDQLDVSSRIFLDYKKQLAAALHREPTAGEAYLAYQQGPAGAAKILSNPDQLAAAVLGNDAVVNNGGNPNMTAGQFASKWTGKFGNPLPPNIQPGGTNFAGNVPIGTLGSSGPMAMSGAPQQSAGQQAITKMVPGFGPMTRDQVMNNEDVPIDETQWDKLPAQPAAGAQGGTPAQVAQATPQQPPQAAPAPANMDRRKAEAMWLVQNAPGTPQGKMAADFLEKLNAPQYHQITTPDGTVLNVAPNGQQTVVYKGANSSENTPATIAEYNLYSKQSKEAGQKPKSFNDWHSEWMGRNGGADQGTISSIADSVVAGDTQALVGLSRVPGLIYQVRQEIARRAELEPDGSIAKKILQNKANQAGNVREQQALGTATTNNILYGNTAAAAMDTAIKASNAVPRGKWMPWNQLVQAVQRGQSDPDLARAYAATNTLRNEYAKATTPVGVPTDSQRNHVDDMLNLAQSPETYEAVVRMMHLEIANAHRGIEATRQQLHSGASGEIPSLETPLPGAPQANGGTPQVKSDADYTALPSGTVFVDPAGQKRKKP